MKASKESEYSEKLRDPRWQKKRLQILERDGWACQFCFDDKSTLHVHHKWYIRGRDPWEYHDDCLIALCASCHEEETDAMPRAEWGLLHALKASGADSDALHMVAAAFEGPHDIAPARSFSDWDTIAYGIHLLLSARRGGSPNWNALRDLSLADKDW